VHVHSASSSYHAESAPPSKTEESQEAGSSQNLPKTTPEGGSPHTAASGEESSAEFLKAASADQADAGEPGSSAETSYGKLLRPPHPGDKADQPSSISHPIRTSSPAEAPPPFDGPPADKLNKLVDGADPYPNERPEVEPHNIANSGLKKYGPNDDDSGTPDNVHQEEGNPGHTPVDAARLTTHPDHADYKQRRQEQILSHFSSVMLYRRNETGGNPKEVEVQYGYLHDGDKLKLYSSANSYKGQEWLKKNSEGDTLLNHVKAAAQQNENPDVKRHALKLLFFEDNQKARRDEIDKDPKLSPADKAKMHADLNETGELHKMFFTGTHHVVTNTGAAQAGEGQKAQGSNKKGKTDGQNGSPSVQIGKAADKRVQRHAEQNIAEQMHQDAPAKGLAEIAGTKIRCGSCNSALGPSVKDEKEGYYITGQYYDGQSSKSRMQQTVAAEDERGRPASKTSTKTGARSSSTSPARVKSEKYYQYRNDNKPPATSKE
jgi:hypothetical protein